jgi:hypothetical protein
VTSTDLVHVPGLGHSEGARKRGPGSGNRADEKFAIEQRRTQVAALYLSKRSEREIARLLHVSRSTIRKDIAATKKAWRERATMDFQAIVDEEIAKMEGMERALIPVAFLGSHEAVGDLLKVMDRKAKLLGLDRPVKIDATFHVDVAAEKARGIELIDEVERQRQRRTG